MVDTAKVAERRELKFSCMKDILDEIEYLDSGDPPQATGNWTPGQIVEHVTKVIDYSIDGFPVRKASFWVRVLGRLVRKKALTDPMRSGIRFPARFAFLEPDRAISWEEAVEHLERTIPRLDSERMNQRSPVLGKLSHEQWEQLHCRHAEMHFSFMQPA